MATPVISDEQKAKLLTELAGVMEREPNQLVVDAVELAADLAGFKHGPWIYDVGMQYIRETMVDEKRDESFHEPTRGKR